jgi:hypothetical protein
MGAEASLQVQDDATDAVTGIGYFAFFNSSHIFTANGVSNSLPSGHIIVPVCLQRSRGGKVVQSHTFEISGNKSVVDLRNKVVDLFELERTKIEMYDFHDNCLDDSSAELSSLPFGSLHRISVCYTEYSTATGTVKPLAKPATPGKTVVLFRQTLKVYHNQRWYVSGWSNQLFPRER